MKEEYEIGMKSFSVLFNMDSSTLKKTLSDICRNRVPNEHLFSGSGNVSKKIYNDIPESITIEFYDWLFINPFGIQYNPEHGKSVDVVKFDKYFTI